MWLLGAGLWAGAVFAAEPQGLPGENPHPIHLVRRPVAPFSAMAQLGRQIFYDPSLSSSGKLSCASCHSPDHAYGPPNDGPVMLGGSTLTRQGARAVPSLTYLDRQPDFSIGPDDPRSRERQSGGDGRARPDLDPRAEDRDADFAERGEHRSAGRPVLGRPR